MKQAGIEQGTPMWSATKGFLDKFVDLNMIVIDVTKVTGGVTKSNTAIRYDVTLLNFDRRQTENLSGAERQRKHRERLKLKVESRHNSNTTSRHDSNARIDKNRIDNTYNAKAFVEPKVSTVKVKKITPPKPPEKPAKEWNWVEYRDGMEKGNRRDLEIIADFFRIKKVTFETKDQAEAGLKRWLKTASLLKKFSDDQLSKATKKAQEQHPDIWNLETVYKKLCA